LYKHIIKYEKFFPSFFLSLISTVCDNICVISLYLSPSLISWEWSMVNGLALEYNFFFPFSKIRISSSFFLSKKWEFFLWIFFDLVLNYLFSKFMISCFSKLIQDSIFAEKCVVQGPFSINLITKCIFGIINLYIYIYIYQY